ncbi:MAG TPA: S-layer homology domain-containing protein [Acidimicrobiia bacterium]|nr:S-layer homology domain-containing protein [Acidimicrobiia bacterium]
MKRIQFRPGRAGGWLLAFILLVGLSAVAASAAGTFTDDDGNVHESNIEAIAAEGITRGCNPPVNDLFCPSDPVTRGQMAAFLVRAMGYTDDGGGDRFTDDDNSVFKSDIDKLATAGVTLGCNPPANTRFCPDTFVSRGQMAAFLVRAMGYTDDGGGDRFTDDDNSVFESDIDKLATASVTLGCNPPANTRFCPTELVLRDQMASFLARALNLQPITPSTTSTTSSTSTTMPGALPPPQDIGPTPAGGKAEVTISNNAPHDLTITFEGPEDRTLTLDSCEDCIEYVVPPPFCPEKGPEVTVLLTPGTYEVVVRAADPDIGAFAGMWSLDGDRAYFSCFIVVVTYS